jgi:hypothetical protein
MTMLMMATVVGNIGRGDQCKAGQAVKAWLVLVYLTHTARRSSEAQGKTGCYGQRVDSLDD